MTKAKIRHFPGAHITSAGAPQPAKPAFQLAWRCYPGVSLCWQIVTVNGQQVYLACDQIQPGIAAQKMQQSIVCFSEAEADEKARQLVQQAQRPQLWRPGMPLPEGVK